MRAEIVRRARQRPAVQIGGRRDEIALHGAEPAGDERACLQLSTRTQISSPSPAGGASTAALLERTLLRSDRNGGFRASAHFLTQLLAEFGSLVGTFRQLVPNSERAEVNSRRCRFTTHLAIRDTKLVHRDRRNIFHVYLVRTAGAQSV
jgi:hypothetical protein